MSKSISTFLGANTPYGFISFFDELYNPYENQRAFIIKGGPGTGKSSFMKRVAEKCEIMNLFTEKIYCSADPQSLDGIIIPEKGVAVADGTSPHVLEPKFPGASEKIINTGEFWNSKKLYENRTEIRTLTLENSLFHRRSSIYLAAAGKLSEENKRIETSYVNKDKIYSYSVRFVNRELPKISNKPGKKYRRFISAISPDGIVFMSDTVKTLCHRIVFIKDEYKAVSDLLIDTVGESAIKRGYDVIFCMCPMSPKGECEHIIIPQAGLSLISHKKSHKFDITPDLTVHEKRFLFDGLSLNKKRLTFNKKLQNELINQSIRCLKNAKNLHDDLEKIYIDSMDFESLDKYLQKITEEIVYM